MTSSTQASVSKTESKCCLGSIREFSETADKAVFAEANGKWVESVRHEEDPDWQALEIVFDDGSLFSFEFSSRIVVQASYSKARQGNLAMKRNYGRVSGNPGHKA